MRFRLLSAMTAIAVCRLAPAALATAAPVTPTFQMKWGNLGAAPAQFNGPLGVATDALGNVYVMDSANGRIQKFGVIGNLILQFGSPGNGNGQLNSPYAAAVDPAGNLYVADTNNHRIQKFTSSGAYVSQWGSFGAGNSQFNAPGGIAVDAAGNVYVADYGNHRVQKFSASGTYLLQWGSSGSGNGQFNGAGGIAIDARGTVYVSDVSNARVQRFSTTGTYLGQLGGPGGGPGQFIIPYGVAVDLVGNVYVADVANHRIQKFDASGAFLTLWGSQGSGDGQFRSPYGVAVDPACNVFVADHDNHRVQKFSGAGSALSPAPAAYLLEWVGPAGGLAADAQSNVYATSNASVRKFSSTGNLLLQWGTAGSGNGQFVNPSAIAVDGAGNVFVVDTGNHRVQKFNAAGTYLTQWGTFGTGNGQFNQPLGIAIDPTGAFVYVVDFGNHRVQKFTTAGSYFSQWGSLGSAPGLFTNPVGVAVDAAGSVYVADRTNNRMEKFTAGGTFIAQWGSTGSGNGQFNAPYYVAIDAAGSVYVAEFGNNRVQRFNATGTYLGQWGSLGSGPGQFDSMYGIAVDPDGNVYASDLGQGRIEKFVMPPTIALVSDVGNDQGRQAQLRFFRSSADAPGVGATVTGYEIYRRIDPLPAPAGSAARNPISNGLERIELAGWSYLLTVPAHGDGEYNVVVPTLTDANAASLNLSAFMIRAATSDPFTVFNSGVESGFSADNLAPSVPSPFTAAYTAGATHLHWGFNAAADFVTFRLYRGVSADFVPGPLNLVTATADTDYVDPGPAGRYYKLTAVDDDGNTSVYALVGPSTTTDVASPATSRGIELGPPHPNPASGRASVRFDLPRKDRMALTVFDVRGRRLRVLADGRFEPGETVVEWDLRDAAGSPVANGLYFVRLVVAGEVRSERLAVIR